MNKLFLIILISVGAWQHFSKSSVANQPISEPTKPLQVKVEKYVPPKTTFKCDGRQHCSQMNSYEEAKYFIQHCPNTKMDGDNDGVPCERQFGKGY